MGSSKLGFQSPNIGTLLITTHEPSSWALGFSDIKGFGAWGLGLRAGDGPTEFEGHG